MSEAPYLGDGPETGRARWVVARDGVRVRAVTWPLTGARGTVFMLPGRTEHAEKYGPTAARLAEAGFASAAIDWRGQGLAQRLLPDPRKGHVGRFSDYQLDLDAWIETSSDLPRPWFMLAHSMGGCIGLRGLKRGLPFSAAGFSAPMWGIKVPGGRQRLFATLTGAASRLGLRAAYAPPPATGPVCYVEVAPFAGNTLTGDAQVWDWMQGQLRSNPDLCIAGPTNGWLAEALRECLALGRMDSPDVPVVTAVGSGEVIVDPEAITARMARWPQGRLVQVEGALHEILMAPEGQRDRFLDPVISLFHELSG